VFRIQVNSIKQKSINLMRPIISRTGQSKIEVGGDEKLNIILCGLRQALSSLPEVTCRTTFYEDALV
jgi:hypothetical protein